jgi:hypothetical protein
MTSPRDTPAALTALLDALEADLLHAPTPDVRSALRETGRSRDSAVYEVRSLLRDVQADDTDRCPPSVLSEKPDGMRVRRH